MVLNLNRKFHILRDYCRQNGLLRVCRYVCANLFVYQKYIVFERDLCQPIEEAPAKIPIVIRPLSTNEDDIDRLVEFWPNDYAYAKYAYTNGVFADMKRMITTRLSMGEECMIAEYKGKIIHMIWVGFQNTHLFNQVVTKRGLSLDEAYTYNSFNVPEYRGNRVMEAVHVEIFRLLKRKGFKRVVTYVESHNLASMKADSRLFRKTNTLYYIGIFGLGKYVLGRAATG